MHTHTRSSHWSDLAQVLERKTSRLELDMAGDEHITL